MRSFEDRVLLLLLVAITLTLGWILLPFYGAVLWGLVGAVVFAPLHRRLARSMHGRDGLAAAVVVLLVVLIVIIPLSLIGAALAQQATGVYGQAQSGQLDIGQYFQKMMEALPTWVVDLLNRFGLGSLAGLKDRLSAMLLRGSQMIAGQALNIGQGTFEFFVNLFLMLYLLFFLLRDQDALSERIATAIPLRTEQRNALLHKFTVVIRATVKGNLVVALAQGALGGLIFWFLGITAGLVLAVMGVTGDRHAQLQTARHHRAAALGRRDGVPLAASSGRSRAGVVSGRALSAGHRSDLAWRDPDRLWRPGHWPRR